MQTRHSKTQHSSFFGGNAHAAIHNKTLSRVRNDAHNRSVNSPEKSYCNRLFQLRRCENGGLAVVAAMSMTGLMLGTGVAVDYGMMVSKHSELQARADGSAIAGAREMQVANTSKTQIVSVATSFATNVSPVSHGSTITVDVTTDEESEISVTVTEEWRPLFAHLISDTVTPVSANAVAKIVGSEKICVLALEETEADTIRLNREAQLQAIGCNVTSNSTAPNSINVGAAGAISSQQTYSAGGYAGSLSSYDPVPVTDSPPVSDPLVDRAPPTFGACDETNLKIGEDTTLSPGVYCGGIVISREAVVTFEPGVYIIKDGSLNLVGQTTMNAENVGFYLTGNSTFKFAVNTTINITAPRDGPMAGLIFFEDRNATEKNLHRIGSDNARLLIGTIYLSRGKLIIDANKPVADLSSYTALVVRQLDLKAGPNVVLNSKYGQTDIPVPAGLSGIGRQIVLAK